MKTKVVGIIALLIVVAALAFTMKDKITLPGSTTTSDETILSDQINSLTDEQLNSISTDLTDYSTAAENDIAGDLGLFMYQ